MARRRERKHASAATFAGTRSRVNVKVRPGRDSESQEPAGCRCLRALMRRTRGAISLAPGRAPRGSDVRASLNLGDRRLTRRCLSSRTARDVPLNAASQRLQATGLSPVVNIATPTITTGGCLNDPRCCCRPDQRSRNIPRNRRSIGRLAVPQQGRRGQWQPGGSAIGVETPDVNGEHARVAAIGAVTTTELMATRVVARPRPSGCRSRRRMRRLRAAASRHAVPLRDTDP